MTVEKLSDLIPPRTAGALPSSRTESMLEAALDSDDIDAVKAQLVHVWAHYQSLEFLLSGREFNAATIANAMADPSIEHDVDSTALAIGYFATGAIDAAYDRAHAVSVYFALGFSAPDALRMIYGHLDHTDPDREVAVDLVEDDGSEG